jgi:T5SS/PEP-CTERM-associated repeat protein
MEVGRGGLGTLNIENGAAATGTFTSIGVFAGGDGAATVTGPGSTLNSNGALNVGYQSGHGTLLVEAGASVVTGSSANIGSVNSNSNGIATIRGAGSKLMTTGINVGAGGTGTLSLEDGAIATSFLAAIGADATSDGTATVTGANSKWTNSNNDMEIGVAGIGRLTVANGGAVQAPNIVIGAQGSVHGNGTLIGIVRNSGLVAPGASTGSLRVTGSYLQTATGAMQLELAGNAPGTTYDQLLASHGLMLNGSLQVSLVGPFMPAAGTTFNLFDGTFFPGTFSTVQLPTLAAGLMWNASRLYTTGELRVTLQGDYNANGKVDAPDYTIWRNTLGQSGVGLPADGNGDHMITRLDFDVWKLHFGEPPGSGASAQVPEPGSLSLLLVAGVLAMFVTGRRAREWPQRPAQLS